MKAAIYIRVSTDEQAAEGYSIEAQRSMLIRKAEALEYTIHEIYIDDGYSAKDMRRPALQRILKDVTTGAFQVVLFWRLDRFTRRSKDFQQIMEKLGKFNCGIKSATENIDTTSAFGRFQLELTVSLAQLERETTAERVHFVMEENHRKGKRQGAVAPYGYDLVDGKLVVNPVQAEVVKRIYALYMNNKSVRYIARLFNQEKIPKSADGSMWADATVYYILTNYTYCGKLRWNYRKLAGAKTGAEIIVDGDHEPIISVEEFEQVQKSRNLRATIGKRATSDFPFTGVLKCGRCGYGMIGGSRKLKSGERRRFYKCLGRFNYGICDMPIISEIGMNSAFMHAFDPDNSEIEKYFIQPEVAAASDSAQILRQLETELANIQKRRKKWQLAYADDAITLEELKERTEEDRQREIFIKSQLEELPTKQKSTWSREEMIQALQQLHDLWYQIDDETAKKNFINEVFSNITINSEIQRGSQAGGPGYNVPVYIQSWDFNA